jgi:hypothetical protein
MSWLSGKKLTAHETACAKNRKKFEIPFSLQNLKPHKQ